MSLACVCVCVCMYLNAAFEAVHTASRVGCFVFGEDDIVLIEEDVSDSRFLPSASTANTQLTLTHQISTLCHGDLTHTRMHTQARKHARTQTHMHTHTHACMHTHTHAHTHARTHTHTHTRKHTHTHAHAHTHTHARTHAHTHTHTHTHARTHTHTHTHTQKSIMSTSNFCFVIQYDTRDASIISLFIVYIIYHFIYLFMFYDHIHPESNKPSLKVKHAISVTLGLPNRTAEKRRI